MAVSNREVADAAFEQLREAAENDHGPSVYHLVEHWLTQPPAGADVSRWQPLLGTAALAQNKRLLTGDAAPLVKFLEQFLKVSPALQVGPSICQMISLSPKGANADPNDA